MVVPTSKGKQIDLIFSSQLSIKPLVLMEAFSSENCLLQIMCFISDEGLTTKRGGGGELSGLV